MASAASCRSRTRTLLLWAAPLVWLGCGGGGGTDIVLPSLSVTTATDGIDIDPDGYSLVIDGTETQRIGVAASVVVEQLTDGQHAIELSGLAANCAVQGENPQSVTLRSGSTATASFAVRCSASNGSIQVVTSTDGSGSDPDGFTLLLDAAPWGPIGPAATASVDGLAPGSHSIGLAGLAANCQVNGANPRPVAVSPGQTVEVPFTVTCTDAGPAPGTVTVTTTTSGSNQDPDGYGVSLDGGATQAIGVNASLLLTGVSAAPHTVQLTGVAANCTVTGSNPRPATVPAAGSVTVAFAVSCVSPPPGTGSVEITAATTGGSLDPDGYRVRLDGGSMQTLPVNGTIAVGSLTPGAHSVRLSGLAANCTVGGANPLPVTITAGQSSAVTFAVTCAVTGPTTGSIQITTATTGASPDPDGYSVSVDGGTPQMIGLNGNRTVGSLSPGAHVVQLTGVAANCTVSGANPQTINVAAGQSATAAYAIACVATEPTTGTLQVSVSTSGGSQDPDGYTVSVDGGAPLSLTVNGNRTIQNLSAGSHSALLGGVAGNCTVAANPQTAAIVAGQTAATSFEVSCVASGPSVNLRIARMYLTQGTQRLEGSVPLVQGRDAFLRVFVTANAANSARPNVRVRFYQNGALTRTLSIPASRSSTPTEVEEETPGSSWNESIPGSLLTGNTSILADVDPENTIVESNEADNNFPSSGSPQALTVQSAPSAQIRFVPILQTANGLQGRVGNAQQLIELARRMYPLDNVTVDVRDVFTATGPLQPLDGNKQWNDILFELEATRVVDGATDRTYYGLVQLGYEFGQVGNGLLRAPSAIGTDNPADVSRVIAHELGHTWGQWHTPSCGPGPATIDQNYPYKDGSIGVFGYDLDRQQLKVPSLPDIMGYCPNPWISDYIYERVLNYRRANPLRSDMAVSQPSVLVWGHIVGGTAVLEPTFQITARPYLPKKPGAFTLQATASDGTAIFGLSFDPVEVADDPEGRKYFAFAVPLDQARASRLASLRLAGPGIRTAALTRSAQQLRQGVVSDEIETRAERGGVTLRWDAAAHPMIMVRDPDTGEVLSFARGGNARVWTGKRAVDLEVSNGVQSQRLRRAISR
jgi:hypothetical protein